MAILAKIGQRGDKLRQNQHLKRSTKVKNVRQIDLFLQNKANFRKSQMDIKLNMTSDYEEKIELDTW